MQFMGVCKGVFQVQAPQFSPFMLQKPRNAKKTPRIKGNYPWNQNPPDKCFLVTAVIQCTAYK